MKVLITLLATCLFSLSAMAVDATHGMVLFGKDKVYAYHLPMFHKVHNKQMVLTFDLSKAVKDQIVNLQDTTFLTFVPAPFDLEKFIAAPFDLTGDVYSGHFEQDGVLVMSGVTLVNPKIEYVKDLIQPTGTTIETYKVFGTKNDTYALHLLDGGKAVDQIFKLTTVEAADFDSAISYKDLNVSAFNIGESYSISTPPGKCPSRNCGNPGVTLATFSVESLYFSDSVMGASMPVIKNAGPQETFFCKTRLCEFPVAKKAEAKPTFCKTRLCEFPVAKKIELKPTFCKTRLCEFPVAKNVEPKSTFCKTRKCEYPKPLPSFTGPVCHATRNGGCYYLP